MKKLYLICNAHIDPVWLWDWEEGVGAALSTFRMAAKFCKEYDGFIFNHNEALLYQWVEEYEPELFREIQELVRIGKWHIMGGWFLQPDCNMPSGEALVRQIEEGLEYFGEKFGVRPKTAINFDPFGHSRGIVQILVKAGYDSYVFCRPSDQACPLPAEDFRWIGFDGSHVLAHRSQEGYNTLMGEVEKKIKGWVKNAGKAERGVLLWGVGNHGGGPSYVDLNQIGELQTKSQEWELIHSIPEAYFEEMKAGADALPEVKKGLNMWAVGCYTSQIRIKQRHRLLESELFMTEKMLSQAALGTDLRYPHDKLQEAQNVLLLSEFHDILPGTSVASVEEGGLRLMDYGLEILEREKRKAFFALSKGQPSAGEGEYPILIYNPHPYPVEGIFECEFQLQNQNWGTSFGLPLMYENGKKLASQVEKEACNMNLDWRKKVVFQACLEPSSMNRFDCKIEWLSNKPKLPSMDDTKLYHFQNKDMEIVINRKTGLVDSLTIGKEQWLKTGAFGLEIMESDGDPWGMRLDSYQERVGAFTLLNQEENRRFFGCGERMESVRIIEDGEVRTVVEAVLGYGQSTACIRYYLPKKGTEIGLNLTVNWNEKGKMLKLVIPTELEDGTPLGETVYGVNEYEKERKESTGQRWTGLFSMNENKALTCINDGTYGVDFDGGDMRISLIHSAAYSAHPIEDRPLLCQDRCIPFMDQGERKFNFRIQAGEVLARREMIHREAVTFHEKPMAVSFFPSGFGQKAKQAVIIENQAVILVSCRKCKEEDTYLLRLYESGGCGCRTKIRFPSLKLESDIPFGPYEIKTMELDVSKGCFREISLC